MLDADDPSKKIPTYILGSKDREAAETKRLQLLEVLYDPTSRQRLDQIQPGWRCLEVGAGTGSVAAWMSERVGPGGEVVAADMDTRRLDWVKMSLCRIVQHNILTDPLEALGIGRFDLAHCRFLICHLVGHQEVAIRRMVKCLKPGGWLVIEDFDMEMMRAASPDHPLSARFDAMQREIFAAPRLTDRVDSIAGRKLSTWFDKAGLIDVRHESRGRVARGGSAIADWNMQGFEAGRSADKDVMSEERYALYRRVFSDPSFYFQEGLCHVAWGRKSFS